MNEFARIRKAHRYGMGDYRAMARQFGHSPKTIRKALANPDPAPYRLTQPRWAPMLGAFHAVIEQILCDDEQAPPKRHTTMQIYSQAKFAMAMPTERTEAILAGVVEAMTFFQAVPHELWWNKPKTVTAQIFKGRAPELHPRYVALVRHYAEA